MEGSPHEIKLWCFKYLDEFIQNDFFFTTKKLSRKYLSWGNTLLLDFFHALKKSEKKIAKKFIKNSTKANDLQIINGTLENESQR